MAKETKKTKAVSVRPKTSPYASSPTTVLFGVGNQRYYVQDALLQRLENLPKYSGYGFNMTPEISFEDMDADTGHTLIHFLHAGVYQTLDKMDDDNMEVGNEGIEISEFRKAVRVAEAATKYGLPDLQQLAQSEMERQGASMDLHDVIKATTENSIAKFLDKNIWLQEYVSQKVRWAFELNCAPFLEQDFFERVSSHTLMRILARNAVCLYNGLKSDLQKERIAVRRASQFEDWDRPCNGENLHSQQSDSDRPVRKAGAWPDFPETIDVLDEPNAGSNSHVLDSGRSFISQADTSELLQKIADDAEDATRVAAPTSTLADTVSVLVGPENIDTATVLNGARAEELTVDEEVLPNSEGPVPYPSTELPTNGTVEDVMVDADPAPLKKKKGKKEKKKKNFHKSMVPDPPPVPNPEIIFDSLHVDALQAPSEVVQELFDMRSEEQIGREEFVQERVQPLDGALQEADCLQVLEEETADPRQVEDTSAVELAEAVADIVANGAERDHDDLGWGGWGFGARSSKKKKKKKGAVSVSDIPVSATAEGEPEPVLTAEHPSPEAEAEPVVTAESPPAELGEDSWGIGWGGTKKTKKKGKREATSDTPPLEEEPALDAELITLDAVVDEADDCKSTTQMTISSEIEDCPWRLRHLFEGDGWESCKPCQAHIRWMASQLQAGK